jgi:Na+/H+ antiporter NhaD/arsenite permease-like protein
MTEQMVLALVLLVALYGALVWDRFSRAVMALLAAALAIFLGLIDQHAAVAGIDFNTLGLLVGMMLVVAVARRSGLFEYGALLALHGARGRPALLLALLTLGTALFSAFLDNVTTILLVAPVTMAICKRLSLDPYPFLFSEIFASNIGGTATLIGDPPNILIGSANGFTFADFATALGPIVLVLLLAQLGIIHFFWGRKLRVEEGVRESALELSARRAIRSRRLLVQSLGVIGAMLLAFIWQRELRQEPATIALGGAAILMLLDSLTIGAGEQHRRAEKVFAETEWVTIFFFIGLFVVVAALERSGLLTLASHHLAATAHGPASLAILILWSSAVLSAFLDNIPFVAAMIPVIKNLGPELGGEAALRPLWWALALGACLGGNGTLIGASANVSMAGLAEREGVHFSFMGYMARAFPLMMGSILIAHLYLWWRYLS